MLHTQVCQEYRDFHQRDDDSEKQLRRHAHLAKDKPVTILERV